MRGVGEWALENAAEGLPLLETWLFARGDCGEDLRRRVALASWIGPLRQFILAHPL